MMASGVRSYCYQTVAGQRDNQNGIKVLVTSKFHNKHNKINIIHFWKDNIDKVLQK